METLYRKHSILINNTKLDFQRSIMQKIPWNERLIGIKGARGVGKTTLLLQYIKNNFELQEQKALYISLDDLYFAEHNLTETAEAFMSKGGTHLFMDEVHKYQNWAIEIKNLYDTYQNLHIVFTGSSLLEIHKASADLSRRALIYHMQGLSLREYINWNTNKNLKELDFNNIIHNHIALTMEITNEVKPLKYFDPYLKTGYFPFYDNNKELYYKRLQEIINMVIEIELPMLRNTEISINPKIKQLLYIISQSVPFKPNITALSNKIKINRKTILNYLHALNDAGLIKTLYKDSFGISLLQKPEKIYLENTNYMYGLSQAMPEAGNLRETFFYNQVAVNHSLNYSEKADFIIDNKYSIEIGGKNKTTHQIADLPDAFLAVDDIEIGFENKIPLWLFGFLY